MREKYTTVKIPYELAQKLDEFSADLGYRSRAEVVNDALRRFIDERRRLDELAPTLTTRKTDSVRNKIPA